MVQGANFNRFQRAGLSATQFMTMNVIPAEGMTLTEMARRLNLSTATLNATVNSLEERGMVRRARDAKDGRRVIISVTREGEAMQNAASREFHEYMAGLFGQMSRTRREGLLAGLEQMVRLGLPRPARQDGEASRREDDAPRRERSSPRSRRR